jgi:hypothetical protein
MDLELEARGDAPRRHCTARRTHGSAYIERHVIIRTCGCHIIEVFRLFTAEWLSEA